MRNQFWRTMAHTHLHEEYQVDIWAGVIDLGEISRPDKYTPPGLLARVPILTRTEYIVPLQGKIPVVQMWSDWKIALLIG